MKVTISIDNNKTIMVLPYVPEGAVKISYGSSLNQNMDSAKYGQIKAIGPEPLAAVSITGVFPRGKTAYAEPGSKIDPMTYIRFFRNNRRNGKPFRVVVTRKDGREIFNRLMACEAFEIEPARRNGDVPYSLEFEQYRAVR